MAKYKISVSLNNLKIKGEEHLKVFLIIDHLEVTIQIYFLKQRKCRVIVSSQYSEVCVILLILMLS